MDYGIRTIISPKVLNGLHDNGYAILERAIRSAMFRKLEEDGLMSSVKRDGLAIEVQYKNLTKSEIRELAKGG